MTTTNQPMEPFPFTSDQLHFLDAFVDEKILRASIARKKKPGGHSAHDIRRLIKNNLATLKEEIGPGEFDLVLLVHCLKKLTQPSAEDLILDDRGISRFQRITDDAIRKWPTDQEPVVLAVRRPCRRVRWIFSPDLPALDQQWPSQA